MTASRYLGSTPFVELLAPSIAGDKTIRDAAVALDPALRESAQAIPALLLFARLANDSGMARPVSLLAPLERLAALSEGLIELQEPVLDLLAWQFHVEGYAEAANIQAKREMIWQSVILHRKHGTPWAVRGGLEATLQMAAEVSEWFDYGGEPFFFRVTLDVSGKPVDARMLENAVKIIFLHKNVRSWLDLLKTKSTRGLPVFIGTGAVNHTKTSAFTWRWPLALAGAIVRSGISLYGKSRWQAALAHRRPEPGALSPYSAFSAYTFTRSRLWPRQ